MNAIVPIGAPAARPRMTLTLQSLSRCPYCAIATPLFTRQWMAGANGTERGDGSPASKWAAYSCSNCGGVIAIKGKPGDGIGFSHSVPEVAGVYPSSPSVSDKLPAIAGVFLRQAFETLHAPDAAAVMAGSAVDAMLKHLGFEKGTLYVRIDEALEAGVLTKGMADWAHSVRLGSNRPRHADKDSPHVSAQDAKRSVDFAEALGNFMFVLTAQIQDAVNEVSPAV
jgi:hypothetical protein